MPLASHLLATGYALVVAPAVYALYLVKEHQWLQSAVLGITWLLVFPFVAAWLHRQRLIHIGLSIFAVVAAVVALPIIFMLPD